MQHGVEALGLLLGGDAQPDGRIDDLEDDPARDGAPEQSRGNTRELHADLVADGHALGEPVPAEDT